MKKRQENKLSMYLLVEKTCNKFQGSMDKIHPFTEAVANFSKVIDEIKSERQIQEEKLTGVTKERNELKTDLVETTLEFITVLKDYTIVAGNVKLADKISYNKWDLQRSRDTILEDRCRLVFKLSEKYFNDIEVYGISQTDFAQFKEILDTYSDHITGTKEAIINRKMATEKLSELFDTGDSLIKRMDSLIRLFRKASPDFVKAYTNARNAIAINVRKKNNQPIAGMQQAA